MKLNNYPRNKENWKPGKTGGCVVTDTEKGFREGTGHTDKEYYGGNLICESIARNKDVRLISATPDLLNACIDFMKSFKSSVGYQKYEESVFKILNDRYIQCNHAIRKATGINYHKKLINNLK